MRRHLSFANLISLIALFVALGGSAYAVHVAKRNSVTSKSIKNGAVQGRDVKDGSLTGADIDVASLGDATGGSTSTDGLCKMPGEVTTSCVSTTVTLKQAGKVFATGQGEGDSGAAGHTAVSRCSLFVDGTEFTQDVVSSFSFSPSIGFTVSAVTDALTPGDHKIEMRCTNHQAGETPEVFDPQLTTLVIGAG